MNRKAAITFADQMRAAREDAIANAEDFNGIIHAIERLGSFLSGRLGTLGGVYQNKLYECASASALAEVIPQQYRHLHTSFTRLYELVEDARNHAVHQGAFARRLTAHAIQMALILEDALRRSSEIQVVEDYMVRDPVLAELWQPLSFIRQQMLAGSFSFLPVQDEGKWYWLSDAELAAHIGTDSKVRDQRLAETLEVAKKHLPLIKVEPCFAGTPTSQAIDAIKERGTPLLVFSKPTSEHIASDATGDLIGIVTAFDLL